MERESFENDEIAALMNERFVNIKVDREERPDVDSIYMSAVAGDDRARRLADVCVHDAGRQALLHRHLLPARRPRWHGLAFPRVLEAAADAYHNRRAKSVLATTGQDRRTARRAQTVASPVQQRADDARDEGLKAYQGTLASMFDSEQRRVRAGAPKFPQAMALDFLLRYWHETHEERKR